MVWMGGVDEVDELVVVENVRFVKMKIVVYIKKSRRNYRRCIC